MNPLISEEPASLAAGLCWTLRDKFLQFVIDINLSMTEVQPLGARCN